MIPGTTSKCSESTVASAATIDAKTDIVKVTSTTTINTINPFFGGGFGGFLGLVPVDGAVTLSTTGNILIGGTAAQNKVTILIYVRSLAKWVINGDS